jgi:hypothetical protein
MKVLKECIQKGIIISVVLLALSSCGNKGNEDEQQTAADTVAKKEVLVSAISSALPSPLQIALIFKKAGVKYNDALTNPTANISKYNSSFSKTLNLGVYSADLSYSVLNKQKQASINYLKNVKQLVSELGMSTIFQNEGLSTRFEKNLDNQDSLATLIADLQMETDFYLEDNDQQQSSPVIFAGAWVETMFIGSSIYTASKDKRLAGKISEQMSVLDNILKALNNVEKKDEELTGTINSLQSIKNFYEGLESVKAYKRLPAGNNGPLILNDPEMGDLAKRITEVRTKFIRA